MKFICRKKKDWVSWDEIYYQKDDGGMGFKSLFDTNKVVVAKLWWNFITTIATLWGIYMVNTYCKKKHASFVVNLSASQMWKSKMAIREEIAFIQWQLRASNFSF